MLKNIVNNPSQTQKFGNLNYDKINKKLLSCKPALQLLFISEFKKSVSDNNQTRLIWNNTTENMTILYSIQQILSFDKNFTTQQALDAIILDDNKNKKEDIIDLNIFKIRSWTCFTQQNNRNNPWNCSVCTYSNISSDSKCQICQTPNPLTQHIWSCPNCTFCNISNISSCIICDVTKYDPSNILSKCHHLKRMINCLKYYTLLNIDDNPSNAHLFNEFCNDVYDQLLNDYQHIITSHEPHLEDIHNELINDNNFGQCKYDKCAFFGRYHDDLSATTQKCDDIKLMFYTDIMDNIHNWLYHMFDSAMRIKRSALNSDQDEQIEDDEDGTNIDITFGRISNHISNTRENIRTSSPRFRANNNKFKMNTTQQQHQQHDANDDGDHDKSQNY